MDAPYAFTTLVTSDHYLPGALAVAAALKELHPSSPTPPEVPFQTVCLVTPETVDVSSIKLLRRAFDVVIGVEIIEQEDRKGLQLLGRPDLSHVLTKLHVFRLTQYSKIIFLDADVLPIRPLSHLFNVPHEFAAVPDVGWPDIFNSGVMVLTPGEDKFKDLMELLKTKGTWDGGDQGLLNEWRGDNWHRLSFTYNTTPTAAYTYAPAYERFGSKISAIHFIGPNKPWTSITYRAPGTKYGQSSNKAADSKSPAYDYDSLVDRWFDIYDRHYRSQDSPEQANFEFTRYDSVWDSTSSGFGAEMGPPSSTPAAGSALGLDDLRKIAIEGINSYNASARQPEERPKIGEYRSLPLEGRVDLMRPRKEPAEESGNKSDDRDQGDRDQAGDSTPKQAFMVLDGGDMPRMDTLPTPLPHEVPGAPYHGPLSLPPSGPPSPYQPAQPGQQESYPPFYQQQIQQQYDDSEWQDSDSPQRYFQQFLAARQQSNAYGPAEGGVTGMPGHWSPQGDRRFWSQTAAQYHAQESEQSDDQGVWQPSWKEIRIHKEVQSVTIMSTTEMLLDRADNTVLRFFPTMSMPGMVTSLRAVLNPPEAFTHLGDTTRPLMPATPLPLIPITLALITRIVQSHITLPSLPRPNRIITTTINTNTSTNINIMTNLLTPPPVSAFPTDTYFPNVWDQGPSQEHDAAHQSFHAHIAGPTSETFFNPPPPAEIPEQLLREGQYENVIGRPVATSPGSPPVPPTPDPKKIHAIFPWEEKPRPAPRRVFPVSDSPPPIAKFIDEPAPPKPFPKQERIPSHVHTPSPPVGLPLNVAYANAWDTVPSIQRYAKKLVRPHHSVHQPPPPEYDEGWRKWDQERERVFQEQQDASSMDGDDEDEGDEDDDTPARAVRWDSESSRERNPPSRSRSGSNASIKGKKYRGRGIQTDRIETRSMGVQVDVWAEEVAAATQKGKETKTSRGTGMATRQWPQLPSGAGLLPPVTMRDFKRDPDQMAVGTPTVTQPPLSVMPFPSTASPTGLRSPQTLGSPRTYSPPKAPSPLRIPSPPKVSSPKVITPPKIPSPKGPPSPRATMSPRRLSSAQVPTSKLAGSPKLGSPVVGPSATSSPRQSPKLTRLTSPFSPPLQRTSSNDTAITSSPSTQGPLETPEGTPIMGPMRKGGRVWDPARGVEVFKRSSEEVLARFLRSGSFDEDEGQRRHV
ncbi:glycosyltransferase family 8 protein [Trametes coccinea BRFM310]|uniref:glycogenin glucosyltransferase n=1 Tax=Trametes coccinea (strain BRFM310) TaxID=1353009 RepID=A0A1Y2IRD7_TRAC3|nr:glycosyltransferase family 8 protein [Trametes coccinea BRFM310]